jgi:Tol biopolymer transport system component
MKSLWIVLAAGGLALAACGGQSPSSAADQPGGPTTTPPPTATVPGPADVAWASLGAKGHLLIDQQVQGVSLVDLASGQLSRLFSPQDPSNDWANAASLSPDGTQAVIAYAPAPQGGEVQYGYTRLYILPTDGSAPPTPFLVPGSSEESYFDPIWSPTGDSIIYAHLVHFSIPNTSPQQYGFKYTIERVSYPGGQIDVVADSGFWPRLSHDGQRLVYVSIDMSTGTTAPVVCNPDGSNPQVIPTPSEFQTIDSPLFTPDGQALLLSVVTQGLSDAGGGNEASWLDRIMGVQVAEAHNIPSDWWRVPLDGSQAVQLTHVNDVGLYGSFSPDGSLFAYGSQSGLFVGNADATGFVQVNDLAGILTVDWVP